MTAISVCDGDNKDEEKGNVDLQSRFQIHKAVFGTFVSGKKNAFSVKKIQVVP